MQTSSTIKSSQGNIISNNTNIVEDDIHNSKTLSNTKESSLEIANKGKFLFDTINEKKLYEEKIKSLNNRIKKLQEQETEINKKTGKLKEKFLIEQKIKHEKNEKKGLIENHKQYMENVFKRRKQEIERIKNYRKEMFEKVEKEKIEKSKQEYKKIKKEKSTLDSIGKEIKNHDSDVRNFKYLKIKQETIEGKAQRYKSLIDKEDEARRKFEERMIIENNNKEKLKDQLKMLEEKEFTYISKLKQTMVMKKSELEEFKMQKLSSSLVDINQSQESINGTTRKNFNRSLETKSRK